MYGMTEEAVSVQVVEVGQDGEAAFVGIQEIVDRLMADPETDWSRIDIDNVTMRAHVTARDIVGGSRFEATSEDPAFTASIRTIVPAHAATINGTEA